MMAARAMGSSDSTTSLNTKGMVTACESYLPMVKLMKKVLHVNGMGRNIKVINKRSDELEVGVDIDSRADILVSIDFFMFAITSCFPPENNYTWLQITEWFKEGKFEN